jgi:hypothetical protein
MPLRLDRQHDSSGIVAAAASDAQQEASRLSNNLPWIKPLMGAPRG